MKEQIKVWAYSAPECRVLALDSFSPMCVTSGFTEDLNEETGEWS